FSINLVLVFSLLLSFKYPCVSQRQQVSEIIFRLNRWGLLTAYDLTNKNKEDLNQKIQNFQKAEYQKQPSILSGLTTAAYVKAQCFLGNWDKEKDLGLNEYDTTLLNACLKENFAEKEDDNLFSSTL
ncbi:MAG: hypothetical protein H0U73_05460, partial [Tatlockia sp.]|nr:hypothetical protein [Tatlockia sp.]